MPKNSDPEKARASRTSSRVRELYVNGGLEPHEIAARLVAEGGEQSIESAIRRIRAEVLRIRAEIEEGRAADAEPGVAFDTLDILARELRRLRQEHRRQELIADGELDADGNEAVAITAIDTPSGPLKTVRPKWPAGVRQKASKDAALLARQISTLELALASAPEKQRSVEVRGESFDWPFQIVMSGLPLDELIELNMKDEI